MDTLSAFIRGQVNAGKEQMVFDWEKAARLIKERNPLVVSAGLRDDWDWTGGIIYAGGAPVPEEETYVYLSSNWAVPEIMLDNEEPVDCYRMQSEVPDWDAKTYWPAEALEILNET